MNPDSYCDNYIDLLIWRKAMDVNPDKPNPFDNYEELREYLKNLPASWYPDLIRTTVISAYKKKVFLVKGASKFIAAIELTEQVNQGLDDGKA